MLTSWIKAAQKQKVPTATARSSKTETHEQDKQEVAHKAELLLETLA